MPLFILETKMKCKPYVSMAATTLAQTPERGHIIELGAVIDDYKTEIENLQTFHCYILHPVIKADSYRLFENNHIFRYFAPYAEKTPKMMVMNQKIGVSLSYWMQRNGFSEWYARGLSKRYELIVAGFDLYPSVLSFLEAQTDFGEYFRIEGHLDPAAFLFDPRKDEVYPFERQCCERLGLTHSRCALQRAINTIRCLRAIWKNHGGKKSCRKSSK